MCLHEITATYDKVGKGTGYKIIRRVIGEFTNELRSLIMSSTINKTDWNTAVNHRIRIGNYDVESCGNTYYYTGFHIYKNFKDVKDRFNHYLLYESYTEEIWEVEYDELMYEGIEYDKEVLVANKMKFIKQIIKQDTPSRDTPLYLLSDPQLDPLFIL